MKATLKFRYRDHAESFANAWARHTLRGHIVGSGLENVEVTVFDIDESDKNWIDNYVSELNKG